MNNLFNHRLIEGWRKCLVGSPPYYFPDDDEFLKDEVNSKKTIEHKSFNEFIGSKEFGPALERDKRLHIGLLPSPYVGNLQKASIFILMLNPGLSPCDYFAEQNGEFRKALVRNLRQENTDNEYPLIFLDPHFAWHPGFEYWQGKLHDITKALVKQECITYQKALSRLAQRLACLELAPYHSKSSPNFAPLQNLPSIRAMIEYVHDVLIPRTQDNEAIIIVMRGGKCWKLEEHKNFRELKNKKIIVYEGYETRSAHLTLKSRGGKAIVKQLQKIIE